MGKPPYRPVRELERAIDRGELDFALAYARELSAGPGRRLDLELALRLLPLIAAQQPHAYDAWALRWLERWIAEARRPTVAKACELAARLDELRAGEKDALQSLRAALQR